MEPDPRGQQPASQPDKTYIPREWTTLATLLLGIIVLMLLVALLIWRLSSPPVFAPLSLPPVTLTPTLTRTPTSTATETATPQPTSTVTRTPFPTSTSTFTPAPTQTPPPTLVAARPDALDTYYSLLRWSPGETNRVIELLEYLPETLPAAARRADDSGYYQAFHAAAIAYGDAMLRFAASDIPTLPWRMARAYHLARAGDEQAAAEYALAIQTILNGGTIRLDGLSNWFTNLQPDLALNIIDLPPSPQHASQYLLEIYGPGGIYLWLVADSSQYRVYPLANLMNYSSPASTSPLDGDLTGSGGVEVILWQTSLASTDVFTLPRVFELSGDAPLELAFQPGDLFTVGLEHRGVWAVQDGALAYNTAAFPACPVEISRMYRWDGRYLTLENASYTLRPPGDPDLLRFCSLVAEHAGLVWGPEAAFQVMEALLPVWPPPTLADGRPPALDALDEWRVKLGVFALLTGREAAGIGYLEEVATSPIIQLSRWQEPARELLRMYRSPVDLYRVCRATDFCDPRLGLAAAVQAYTPERLDALEILRQVGVVQRSSGFYDFDHDGQIERWFTVQHRPGSRLEFWIMSQSPGRMVALFIDTVDTALLTISSFDVPPDLSDRFGFSTAPVVWLGAQASFRIEREPVTEIPFVNYQPRIYFYDRLTQRTVRQAEADLFSGTDPETIRRRLVSLRTNEQLACITNAEICAHYYTILGLASEYLDLEADAVNSYLNVWRRAPASLLTTFARLKVQRDPAAPTQTPMTPTATLTRTPTITRTITPTRTVTPTRTITPTPTITLTPSESYTPTVSVTPSVTMTPTLTGIPTATLTPTP
jgi:hypothetical protein